MLTAIHEPSEWMKEAGAELVRYVGAEEGQRGHEQDAGNIWRYMIDSMFKDFD